MHRIGSRRYVGEPGETVTVTNQVSDGGQASVIVDGVDMGPNAQFQLPSDPGGQIQWQVHLSGDQGETTVVTTCNVDGGCDEDFLICQVHNPTPVNTYECAVASASALRVLSRTRSAGARKAPQQRKAAKSATRKPAGNKGASKNRAMKGGARTVTKKRAAKKKGAAKTAKKRGRS